MACEKCWEDAYFRHLDDPGKTQADHYSDLLQERKENPCGPEYESGAVFEKEREPCG